MASAKKALKVKSDSNNVNVDNSTNDVSVNPSANSSTNYAEYIRRVVLNLEKDASQSKDLGNEIIVEGVRQNNLKNISLTIPKNKFVVITGPSGSGKSSLAFETIYAEGQRRYMESLSTYARQFLNMQDKPDFDSICGLSPAIAIDQRTTSRNPRSTVATITEIYDYLRILFARIGIPYSPATNMPIKSISISEMIDEIMRLPFGTKLNILSPVIRGQKGEQKKILLNLRKSGYERLRFNGLVTDIDEVIMTIDKNKKNDIEAVIDRIQVRRTRTPRTGMPSNRNLRISDTCNFPQAIRFRPTRKRRTLST